MLMIYFHNDGTGDAIEGNYDVSVFINKTLLWEGRIEEHNRLTGWQGLVRLLAMKTLEDMNNYGKE